MATRRSAQPRRRGASLTTQPQLIIITGLSGSGKGTVLKTLEDHGYYSVDNLPLDLIPKFAELTRDSANLKRAALVVDIREGNDLRGFPAVYAQVRELVPAQLVFLDADDKAILRRFSETRRPHPLGGRSVLKSIQAERRMLEPIRSLADHIIPTSELNVHQLRKKIGEIFGSQGKSSRIAISIMSFGFRHGVPVESDLVFDVRFLPNPNYVPEFKERSGKELPVARYILSFPQTREFLDHVSRMLLFLMPHYVAEGKSYLTIAFGCTGGHHRSVMMAEEIARRLRSGGYPAKILHRDLAK